MSYIAAVSTSTVGVDKIKKMLLESNPLLEGTTKAVAFARVAFFQKTGGPELKWFLQAPSFSNLLFCDCH